jgi:hypothetical protein
MTDPHLCGMDRVWAQAVVASREAAQRDRDIALREVTWLRNQMGDVRGMQTDGATPEDMDHALGRALSGERARLEFDQNRSETVGPSERSSQ